jgi:hypothetical protein
MIFYTVKTQKNKSRSNLQINWTEFGPKFGGIVEVIEVLKKLKFNYANIRNLE